MWYTNFLSLCVYVSYTTSINTCFRTWLWAHHGTFWDPRQLSHSFTSGVWLATRHTKSCKYISSIWKEFPHRDWICWIERCKHSSNSQLNICICAQVFLFIHFRLFFLWKLRSIILVILLLEGLSLLWNIFFWPMNKGSLFSSF